MGGVVSLHHFDYFNGRSLGPRRQRSRRGARVWVPVRRSKQGGLDHSRRWGRPLSQQLSDGLSRQSEEVGRGRIAFSVGSATTTTLTTSHFTLVMKSLE